MFVTEGMGRTVAGSRGPHASVNAGLRMIRLYRPTPRYRRSLVTRLWTTTLLLRTLLAGVAVVGAVPAASAQDRSRDQAVADARVESVRPRLVAAVARARADGLPAAWIEEKVREGLAKHVPPARIAAAVEQLAGRMHEAATLAHSVPIRERTELARAVLDALTAGARGTELAELVREVGPGNHGNTVDALQALRAVAELGERGFDAELATRSTLTAWRNGGRDGLRAVVELARRIPRGEAHARGDELAREAASPRERGLGRGNGSRDSVDRQRPAEHGGPPRDDSLTQGASRGRGHAEN